MRFHSLMWRLCLAFSVIIVPVISAQSASAAGLPQLVISQLKLTSSNGQFVTLYNQSAGAIDLSQYEIDYLNSTSKLASIPITGQLAPHGYYMLSDDQVRMCYQMTINAVSLGFATTSGSLQIWQLSADKTSKQLQDSVAWASKATTGAVTLPTQNAASSVSLLRQPTDSLGNPQVAIASTGTWQAVAPDATNPCSLDIINTVTTTSSPSGNPGNQLGIGQAAPSTIVNVQSDDSSSSNVVALMPPEDVGLNAPQITEVLPNPDGTGNDDTDEFVELFNPNASAFHLVGFTLQTGTATKHSYTFPDGTILPPLGFMAFYSADTGLSLSNTAGQADLLDPFGNLLGQTDAYGTAKDGQAWAQANGSWFWTTQPTPGAANVVKQAAAAAKASKATAKSTAGKKTSSAVKGASTTAGSSTGTANAADAASTPAPIHPLILAAVVLAAVGYGVYEYRHDLANALHRLRKHRTARSAVGG